MNIFMPSTRVIARILFLNILLLAYTCILPAPLPGEQLLTESEYDIILDNPEIEYAYIPNDVITALRSACTAHPNLKTIITLDISQEHAIIPHANARKEFQLLTLFLATHEHDLPQEITSAINEYTHDLAAGDGKIIVEALDDTTRRSCHTKVYCNLSVRNMLTTRWLHVCSNAVIEGDLTVNGVIHGTIAGSTPETTFITENGTAVTAGNILNVAGTPNIKTSGAGNTVTIGIDGTTDNAVQIGNPAGALTSLPLGTDGQVIIGATGASPLFANITSVGGSVQILGGPNSLNLEATGTLSPMAIVTENGTAMGIAGVINLLGSPNIKTSGAGNTVTIGIDDTTDHAVQIGNATNSLTSLAVGTNGQVLIGATGADPAFATLTSSNNSILFTPGANTLDLVTATTINSITFITENGTATTLNGIITFTGTPNIKTSASGNTVTIGVDGTTDHAVQVGNAAGALSSIPTGTNGQVLIGADGADPAFATLTSSNGSIVFTPGANSLDLITATTISTITFITENGTATTLNGVITFTGTPNIKTSASGNTVTIGVDGTTDHAVQIGNAAGALTSIPVGTNGQVLIGATGADPAFAFLTSNNGSIMFTTSANALDLAATNTMAFGNTVRVDAVFGNDATGQRNGAPFLTITAALAAAIAGDMAWIFPGTYVETFTIPTGVAVQGTSQSVVKISKFATVATDLITMGENSTLTDVTLTLSSASHVQLRGIVFPGTTSETAKVSNISLFVDNSIAGAGTSNVYGIHSNGTGHPIEHITTLQQSNIVVRSTGSGTKRGILIDTNNDFHVRDSTITATNISGAGSAIGVETNSASAEFDVRASTIEGSTADVSQTQGVMTIVTTDLLNSNANSLYFSTKITPALLTFGDPGVLPNATRYLYPGTEAASSNEIFVRFPTSVIVKNLSITARVAPGVGNAVTVTVRKNSINTTLATTLSDASTLATNNAVSVSFAPGDSISVSTVGAPTSGALADIQVKVELY